MGYNKYWNMTDEELLHTAFNDEQCPALAHELAMRLQHALDEQATHEAPEWARKLCEDQ